IAKLDQGKRLGPDPDQFGLVRTLTLTPALTLEGRGGRTAQDITLRLCESINNASHFHCNHNQMQPRVADCVTSRVDIVRVCF
ncbi:hypothetical protein LVV75_22205, partial [Escherichia coli]|uniref:hypothetical protein n=1 Tax=Escherichia coli TaxID=562 RepID=UPI002247E9D4